MRYFLILLGIMLSTAATASDSKTTDNLYLNYPCDFKNFSIDFIDSDLQPSSEMLHLNAILNHDTAKRLSGFSKKNLGQYVVIHINSITLPETRIMSPLNSNVRINISKKTAQMLFPVLLNNECKQK